MARLLGVRADRVIAIAFAISGALAAMVGVLIVMQTGQVSPTMGLTPVLVGFIAVVIGGFGRIFGAAVGGLLLGVLSSLLGTYLAACTVYATLYARRSEGNAYDYKGTIAREDALFLQKVADDTVSKFFGRPLQ